MFFWKKKSHDKKGYKFKLKGRSEIFYSELYANSDHEALIACELMSSPAYISVYFSTFNAWLPPFENEIISPEDKERIRHKIATELELLGKQIDWE